MNFFDIIIIGLVLIGAIQGYRKGLISGLVSLGGTILGLILAAKNHVILQQWLDQNTPLRAWLETGIHKRMQAFVEAKAQSFQEETLEKFLSMFPEELRGVLGGANLPDMQGYTENMLQSMAFNLAQAITDSTLKIISFALVYFAVIIIVEVISAVILTPLGLLSRSINGGGGFLVGGFVSFLGLAVFAGLFVPLLTVLSPGETINFLEESTMLPYLDKTFVYLGDFLRLNLEKGLSWPLDLQEFNLPLDFKDFLITNPHAIDL